MKKQYKKFFLTKCQGLLILKMMFFLLLGKVCIVCCEIALYQFDFQYRRFVSHEKLYQNCLLYNNTECNCLYFLVSMNYVQIVSIIFLKWFLLDLLK